jgi:ubiquinone/menaquinone biosynthesis C-methylase UbiE
MISSLQKALFTARQGARVAWFYGHYLAAQKRQEPPQTKSGEPFRAQRPLPDRSDLLADLAGLLSRDLNNADQGIYAVPVDHDGNLLSILSKSRAFFSDLSEVNKRRQTRDVHEVRKLEIDEDLPNYFTQNFHFQTGGYLTEESAKLYDMQVEVLFTGAANAMRRQALVPLAEYIKDKDQRRLRLLDVACGTGRFLRFVKKTYPRLNVTGLDLSQSYLDEASIHLKQYTGIKMLLANAEDMPLADGSQDVITSIFLFHELPPKIRKIVAADIARCLKPGGRFIFVDSIQNGDAEGYDGLLELFAAGFHEPYMSSYVREDFIEMFGDVGLENKGFDRAFLSKVMVFDKPG